MIRRLAPALAVVSLVAGTPAHAASRPSTAREVVVRFMRALSRGDRASACRLYPGFLPCARGDALRRLGVPWIVHGRGVAFGAVWEISVTVGEVHGVVVLEGDGSGSYLIVSFVAD